LEISHGFLYLADLNPRFGSEPGKVRPILVIQTDLLNQANHPSTWILPCTTNLVGENLLRVPLPKGIAGNTEPCEIMIDQSRAIDNRRIKKKLKPLPISLLNEVKEKLRLLADIN
jgi:mRNA interferase MazF